MSEQPQFPAIGVAPVHEHCVRRQGAGRLLDDDLPHIGGRPGRRQLLGDVLEESRAVGGELRLHPLGLLELVQARPLECLAAGFRCHRGQRDHVLVDGMRMREREPRRAHHLACDLERHGERRGRVAHEPGAVGVHALELATRVRVGRLPRACRGRDRRSGREGQAQARLKRGTRRRARVDDHELSVVDQPERASGRAQEIGHVRHERLRNLRRGSGGRESARELLEIPRRRRRLLGLGGAHRLLAAQPLKAPGDPDEHEGDDEAGRPAPGDRVVLDRELPAGLYVEEQAEPRGPDRHVGGADSEEHGDERAWAPPGAS